MNYRTLIVLASGGVCGLALWMSFYSPKVSAQSNGSAPSVPVYNPYPPGILPPDLSSEIARVLREVDFVESRAITRWHNLKPPLLTGQPPVLQNTGLRQQKHWASLCSSTRTSRRTRIKRARLATCRTLVLAVRSRQST